MVANDNEPIPHTECREGRVETHEASLSESLSRLELTIIALAEADSPASLSSLPACTDGIAFLLPRGCPTGSRIRDLRRCGVSRFWLATASLMTLANV